jgi:4-hydroxybenzoate polyprenyltransferase
MIKKLTSIFRIIRPVNLIIIFIIQSIFYFWVMLPIYIRESIRPILSQMDFFIVTSATILSSAAGYIVNDIYDVDIDRLNKSHKLIITNTLSKRFAWILYLLLIIGGMLFFSFKGIESKNYEAIYLFVAINVILYWYAVYFKRSLILGNIVVAVLCAAVIPIIFHFERKNIILLEKNSANIETLYATIEFYTIFAFLTTLIREIIKDLEDIEGDKAHRCQTLPIEFGTRITKIIIVLLLLIFGYFVTQFSLTLLFRMNNMSYILAVLFIVIPMLILFYQIIRAKTKKDFHRASITAKILMLSGMLSLILMNLSNF